jgi:hypothetical protein
MIDRIRKVLGALQPRFYFTLVGKDRTPAISRYAVNGESPLLFPPPDRADITVQKSSDLLPRIEAPVFRRGHEVALPLARRFAIGTLVLNCPESPAIAN